jgi:hypothetical protein
MSDPSFDSNTVEGGDFDHIQRGMMIGFYTFNNRNQPMKRGIVLSKVYLKLFTYMVEVFWNNRRIKIKTVWIKEIINETG